VQHLRHHWDGGTEEFLNIKSNKILIMSFEKSYSRIDSNSRFKSNSILPITNCKMLLQIYVATTHKNYCCLKVVTGLDKSPIGCQTGQMVDQFALYFIFFGQVVNTPVDVIQGPRHGLIFTLKVKSFCSNFCQKLVL